MPNPLPATIAGHILPLAWTDPDVQAFRAPPTLGHQHQVDVPACRLRSDPAVINHDTLERLRDELANLHPSVVVERQGLEPPPADLRCCANCAHWHKKEYIHCQCSGPWGGNIFGDKNCTFRASEPTPGYAGDNNGE